MLSAASGDARLQRQAMEDAVTLAFHVLDIRGGRGERQMFLDFAALLLESPARAAFLSLLRLVVSVCL